MHLRCSHPDENDWRGRNGARVLNEDREALRVQSNAAKLRSREWMVSAAMAWSGWKRDYDSFGGGVDWRLESLEEKMDSLRKYLFRIISIGNID